MADENTSLIQSPSEEAQHYQGDDELNGWSDLILLSKRTIPICLSFALQNAVQAASVLAAGRLGAFELEVASYGFMFISCTGSMVAIGGATALDTLCAQSFASDVVAKDSKVLGRLLQQSLLALVGIFAIGIAPVWVFSGRIFISLGQEHNFAQTTGTFVVLMLPAGVLQVVAECLRKFLQVQEESNTVGAVTLIASVITVAVNFVLVLQTKLKLWGIPCAFGIYQLVTVFLLLGVIVKKPAVRQTWSPSMSGMSSGLLRLLFFAITGIMTIATEWWSFEILAMLAARLDSSSIGAHSILMSSDLLFTTISLGISVAASHRIGGLLGANRGIQARKATATPFLLSIIIGAFEFVVIMLACNVYGRIFTNDLAVIIKTSQVLPLMAGFQVLDLSNGAAGGILRGAGKNHLSGASNFLGYYGVGLTSAWFLCFQKDFGVYGLWLGIIAGSGALLVFQCFFILRIRWKALAAEVSGIHNT